MVTEQLPQLLRFRCPHCWAELSVPSELAGVAGPCPSCNGPIQAPQLETPAPVANESPFFQPAAAASPEAPPTSAAEERFHSGVASASSKNASGFETDDSWKDRHRKEARQHRRRRNVDKKINTFFASKLFRVTRVVVTLVALALVVWLASYMKKNKGYAPWSKRPEVNRGAPAASPETGGSTGMAADAATESPNSQLARPAGEPSSSAGAGLASPIPTDPPPVTTNPGVRRAGSSPGEKPATDLPTEQVSPPVETNAPAEETTFKENDPPSAKPPGKPTKITSKVRNP